MEKYRTFWKRFFAAIIDSLVLIPISWPGDSIVQSNNKTLFICWLFFYASLLTFYSAFLHARYGQTLGKRIMSIKVLDLNESKTIGFKRAFYREIIWFLFNLVGIIFLIYKSTSDTTYTMESLKLQFDDFMFITALSWMFVELLTMLTNVKRRAIHDFLAQSVVIDVVSFPSFRPTRD